MRRLDLHIAEQSAAVPPHGGTDRSRLLRKGLRLEYLSLGWNLVEGAVALAAGLAAGSVALIGFGADSFVESASAGVIVWRILAERRNAHSTRTESVEHLAQKLVSASLALLGSYILYGSISALALQKQPDASLPGVLLAAASLGVMWWIAKSVHEVGAKLHSHSIQADSRQTLACWWMSLSLLIGLALNMAFGWWWADPVAGVAIAGFVFRESWNAWRGEDCCAL